LDWRSLRGRCTVQMNVIQSVADIISSHYGTLSVSNLEVASA
jgi:hypothetical protein